MLNFRHKTAVCQYDGAMPTNFFNEARGWSSGNPWCVYSNSVGGGRPLRPKDVVCTRFISMVPSAPPAVSSSLASTASALSLHELMSVGAVDLTGLVGHVNARRCNGVHTLFRRQNLELPCSSGSARGRCHRAVLVDARQLARVSNVSNRTST